MNVGTRRGARLEDPGAEFLGRISDFWQDNGRLGLMVLGGLVLIGAAVFFVQRSRAEAEARAAGQLAEATVHFWQGDYQRSLDLAKSVNQQYGSTASGVDALRLAGDNAFWLADYKAAIESYRGYLAKQKDGMLADAVRRSLAYTLETDGQHAEAAALYMQLVGRFDRESSGEFLLSAARAYAAAGQPAEAKAALERLANEFGDTTYSRRGREMIAEIEAAAG